LTINQALQVGQENCILSKSVNSSCCETQLVIFFNGICVFNLELVKIKIILIVKKIND